MKRSALTMTMALLLLAPAAQAAPNTTLPTPVFMAAKSQEPLQPVGSGTYRKIGFSIYEATLWGPNGVWQEDIKPYVLQLRYNRDLSKDTVVDAILSDLEPQAPDEATFARWSEQITATLPAVKDGDELSGVAIPGKPSILFYNGKQIASITDAALSKAFFAIWLGDRADKSLRAQLIGKEERYSRSE